MMISFYYQVELLELIQCLDFKVIHHLETVCETVKRGSHHYLGVSVRSMNEREIGYGHCRAADKGST